MDIPLSKNFKKSEFRCRDGSDVPPELMDNLRELVENLQVIRDHINKPVRVISGYRTPKYNRRIGGARRSQHMKAKAADLRVRGVSAAELREIILKLIKEKKIKKGILYAQVHDVPLILHIVNMIVSGSIVFLSLSVTHCTQTNTLFA